MAPTIAAPLLRYSRVSGRFVGSLTLGPLSPPATSSVDFPSHVEEPQAARQEQGGGAKFDFVAGQPADHREQR
jgi:hypothetical protein